MAGLEVERSRVLAFRLRAQHLHQRLSPRALAVAAYGGLQDSAPRSGIMSLHARVEDILPAAWEEPALMQIWGPRGAVYLIPADAFPDFTRGRLPRDPAARERLENRARAAAALLGAGATPPGEVAAQIAGLERDIDLRPVAVAGTFRIRWDTRTTTLFAVPPPKGDPETARVGLARRFVRWFGPTGPQAFAAWAGIAPEDAQQTWTQLKPELIPVAAESSATRWLHAQDEALLRSTDPVEGVRLLPPDDPFMKLDRDLLVPRTDLRRQLFPVPGRGSPPFLPGGLLVNEEMAGTWSRKGRRITFYPWRDLEPEIRSVAETEAAAIPIEPRTQVVRTHWDSPAAI